MLEEGLESESTHVSPIHPVEEELQELAPTPIFV
jgi:hypothetical protein